MIFFFLKHVFYELGERDPKLWRVESEQRGSPLCPVSPKPETPASSLPESAGHKELCSTWEQAAH